jgi:hypothetical protein
VVSGFTGSFDVVLEVEKRGGEVRRGGRGGGHSDAAPEAHDQGGRMGMEKGMKGVRIREERRTGGREIAGSSWRVEMGEG